MKGIITKVEVLEESDYNSIGEDHVVHFETFPQLRNQFIVREDNRSLWHTSVVYKLEVINDKSTLITTKYSVYVLTIE